MNQVTQTRLLDLFHWTDLVGLPVCATRSSTGHRCRLDAHGLCSSVGKHLWLDLGGEGRVPRSNAEAFISPIECKDIVRHILERFRDKDFQLHAPSVLLFERLLGKRKEIKPSDLAPLQHYLREWMPLSCFGGVAGPLRMLVANGTIEDLEDLCQRIHLTEEEEHIQLACSVHSRGWQDQDIWIKTTKESTLRFEDVDACLEDLHHALADACQGRSVERLAHWLKGTSDRFRHMIISSLPKGLKLEGCTAAMQWLLLETLNKEPSPELRLSIVRALGRIVILKGEEACHRTLDWMDSTTCAQSFHMALRSLAWMTPTRTADPLFQRLERLEERVDPTSREYVGMVRRCLEGCEWSDHDLVTRLSAPHGWLDDLSDPTLPLRGRLKDLVEGTVSRKTMQSLCRHPKIPSWLRRIWISGLRHPF